MEMELKLRVECVYVRFYVHFKVIAWKLFHRSTVKQQADNGLEMGLRNCVLMVGCT